MTIRVVYDKEPSFPATDQHPNAVRYQAGRYWVDAIGGEPTEQDVSEFLNPPSDTVDTDALNAALTEDGSIFRALAGYVFGLAKGTIAVDPNLTQAQFRQALKARMR